MIPSFILTLFVGLVYTVGRAEVAEQADAHDSKSCSFGIVGSIPTFGITLKERRALVCNSEPLYHSIAGTRPLLVPCESASVLSRFVLPSLLPVC